MYSKLLGRPAGGIILQNSEISAHEKARDAGLLRTMGKWGFAAAIVNVTIGAGIFSLPASMALYAGAQAPLAFFVCAIAMVAVVLCFAEALSRVPTSGGTYGAVDAAFGPMWGVVTAATVYISNVLALGGIAAAFADGLSSYFPQIPSNILRPILIISIVGAFGLINVLGTEKSAKLISFGTVIKLLPLAIFILIGGFLVFASPQVAPLNLVQSDFGRAVILALFAFSGMETILSASGEVKDPAKTIPKSLFIAMGGVLFFYVSIQLISQSLLGNELAASKTPLADGIGKYVAPLGLLLLFGATMSRVIWVASSVLGAPRILFAMARDGNLPKILGLVHAKNSTPHVAIWVHVILGILLALSGTFEQLAVLSGLATAGTYFFTCAAAWKLQRENIAIMGTPFTFKLLPIAAIIGMVSMVVILFMGARDEIIGFFVLVFATIGLYYLNRFFSKSAK